MCMCVCVYVVSEFVSFHSSFASYQLVEMRSTRGKMPISSNDRLRLRFCCCCCLLSFSSYNPVISLRCFLLIVATSPNPPCILFVKCFSPIVFHSHRCHGAVRLLAFTRNLLCHVFKLKMCAIVAAERSMSAVSVVRARAIRAVVTAHHRSHAHSRFIGIGWPCRTRNGERKNCL